MTEGEGHRERSRSRSWRARPVRPAWAEILRHLAFGLAVFAVFWLSVTTPAGAQPLQIVVGSVAVVGTLLSSQLPLVGASLAAAATAIAWPLGLTADPFLLASIGVFAVAERRGSQRFPWWLLAAGALLGMIMLLLGSEPTDGMFDPRMRALLLSAVVIGAAWVLGVRTRQARESAATQARTEERLRLARDVHDVLSHSLGTIGVRAGVAAHVTSLREPELRGVLREVEEQSRSSLGELKSLLQHERTHIDSPASSLHALLSVVIGAAEQAGIHTVVHYTGEPDSIPTPARTTLYRIAQEAVTNTIRHAAASQLRLDLNVGASAVELVVADDGKRNRQRVREGHGLTGMRERVAAVDGELRLESSDHGFTVTATLPLPQLTGRPQ